MALAFFLRVSVALGLHPHELVEPLVRERAIEPVQERRGRSNLVVVLALRKHRHLVELFGEPGRRLGDVNKAVLDHPGLRVQAPQLQPAKNLTRDCKVAPSRLAKNAPKPAAL